MSLRAALWRSNPQQNEEIASGKKQEHPRNTCTSMQVQMRRKQIMNIINVGYDSTNYYLLEIKNGKLLVDSGFPGTLPKLSAELKRKGSSLSEIKYFLPTHYHPDHAGLAQELKNQGAKLIVLEQQMRF